ncbi:TetR/AcrR family transcriptional regulator [Kineococcus sp. NPDC059986]|uniref:TetR/AcrR family transcriptional regulator n=1 Tax=Kineococcus sp. NPDC059986 TaxID=3155538 RepID=UPI00344DFEC9
MSTPGTRPRGGEPAREALLTAATTLFLRHGYAATGTDLVAATAAVSKQTLYNQFGDKESLFRAVAGAVTARAQGFAATLPEAFAAAAAPADVEEVLRGIARTYLRTVARPEVLAVRRLVVGEAARFPDVARGYHDAAVVGTLAALGAGLTDLATRGLLPVTDPAQAAEDLAYALLGPVLDRGLFRVEEPLPTPEALDARADRVVRAFLAARHG